MERRAIMPPSGFSSHAVRGALQFVGGCYRDLLAEVESGKHPDYETAIKHELTQIEMALSKLHISPTGELVER
jgi:hypothetical protein